MSNIPLPSGADQFAQYLQGLRDDIRRATPRRLGQSAITAGTLEVTAGGAIRIREGARLIIEDGGLLQTDVAATRSATLGHLDQVESIEINHAPVAASWTAAATVKLTPPPWASAVIVTGHGYVAATSTGVPTDVYGRLAVGEATGPVTLAGWDAMGLTATWAGTWCWRATCDPDKAVIVALDAYAANPGMLTDATRARLSVHAIWLA